MLGLELFGELVGLLILTSLMAALTFDSNGFANTKFRPLSAIGAGFMVAPRPVCCIALKKSENGRVSNAIGLKLGVVSALSKDDASMGLIDEELLGRDFKFLPAFDEYVKAMESVKTGMDRGESSPETNRGGKYIRPKGDSSVGRHYLDFIGKGNKFGNSARDTAKKLLHNHGSSKLPLSNQEVSMGAKKNKETKASMQPRDVITRTHNYGVRNTNSGESRYSSKANRVGEYKYLNKLMATVTVKARTSNSQKGLQEGEISHGQRIQLVKSAANQRKSGTDKFVRDRKGEGTIHEAEDDTKIHVGYNDKREPIGNNYIENKEVIRQKSLLGSGLHDGQSVRGKIDYDDDDVDFDRKAFQTFEEFTDVRNRPRVLRMEMEERIQKLAKWLNGTDVNLPEWQFSKMIHSAKIKFSDHSILRVIQILGALGNWRRALQVVEWLRTRERFKSYKTKYIYTTMLNVLGKARRPVEALNIFHAMRKELSSYPDMAAYHCIAVTLGQAGYLKELFDVIDCMKTPPKKLNNASKLDPDAVVYNAVLNACVCQKQWEGAFWVLQQLREKHMQPSSTTYGLVMEVMLACGKYNLVHEFFRKVEKSSIPNALNYKVLVDALWKEGKPDDAVSVVQDMERRGIVGSASLYYDLARCLCSAGRPQAALHQVEKICKVATKPLVVTLTGLIQACLESGSIEDGSYIFNHMHKFCSPNLVTYNIMLKAYVEHGRFGDAKDIYAKIIDGTRYIVNVRDYKERVVPDKYMFSIMLDACVSENSWSDFASVYQQMLQHGFPFIEKCHFRMILEALKAGQVEPLDATWNHLVQLGRTLPSPIVKARFCSKMQEGEVGAAVASIPSHHSKYMYSFSQKAWLDLLVKNGDTFQMDSIKVLVQELNSILAEHEQENPILENLLYACKTFVDNKSYISS